MSDGTLGDVRRQAEETARRCARLHGRVLGYNLPYPEPEITNELWFEFLLEHPELTGWAADE